MLGILELLVKWWIFGAAVILSAGAVCLLAFRLADAKRENRKSKDRNDKAFFSFGAIFAAAFISLLSGCMNVYTRMPLTNSRIERTYQSTEQMAALSCVVAFPQIMSPDGSNGFDPWNIVTVPLGIVCLVDDALEAVCDTAFWPADRMLEKKRKWERTRKEKTNDDIR